MAILPFDAKLAQAGDEQPNPDAPKITFADFWRCYPRRQARVDAEKAWKQIGGERYPYMLTAIERAKETDQWQRNNGQYIPMPASYLRGKRFDDELGDDVTMGECMWNRNNNREPGEPKCSQPGVGEKKGIVYCAEHIQRVGW